MPKPASGNVVPKVPSKVPPVASPCKCRSDRISSTIACATSHCAARARLTSGTIFQSDVPLRETAELWIQAHRDPITIGLTDTCGALQLLLGAHLSAIDAINVLPDPNTHSGIVYVQTEDVMLYFRGWEDWSYDNYGWTRRY